MREEREREGGKKHVYALHCKGVKETTERRLMLRAEGRRGSHKWVNDIWHLIDLINS